MLLRGLSQSSLLVHHRVYPNVASNPHDPSPLIPLPARCTNLGCTVAGRGQGEGQVPLRMKGHHATEKPFSFSRERSIVHASHAFFATMEFTEDFQVFGSGCFVRNIKDAL